MGMSRYRVQDHQYTENKASRVNWFKTEPEKGQFKWFDERVELAAAQGLKILGVIEKPPYWASSGNPRKNVSEKKFMGYPPANLDEFGNYVYRMVNITRIVMA